MQCRELVSIATNNRVSPEDKIQELENDRFNLYLDNISYNKFRWLHLDNKYTLWQIKDISPKLLAVPLESKNTPNTVEVENINYVPIIT